MLHKAPHSPKAGSRLAHGAELDLDQARIGSMADEGGASGAAMDAHEQSIPPMLLRPRRSWQRWLVFGAVFVGAAALTAWFSRRR